MGRLGKCCCTGDCLTPFTCSSWNASWGGRTANIAADGWIYVDGPNTISGSSSEKTITKTTTFNDSYTGLGPTTCTVTCKYETRWSGSQYLRFKRGALVAELYCPLGGLAPYPNPLSLPAGSPTGLATTRLSPDCAASLSATVQSSVIVTFDIKINQMKTVWTNNLGSFVCDRTSGPFVIDTYGAAESFQYSIPVTIGAWKTNAFRMSRGTLGPFVSPWQPYSTLSGLHGTHRLYYSPLAYNPCGVVYSYNYFSQATFDPVETANFWGVNSYQVFYNGSLFFPGNFKKCDWSNTTFVSSQIVPWAYPYFFWPGSSVNYNPYMDVTLGSCLTIGSSGGEV